MSESVKSSVLGNGLIWFGAAVSIAEIMTGALFAPLGFWKALAAIVFGHVIGCTLLYFAGLLGVRSGKCAMETAKLSFGERGGGVFACLNVLQLVGWTAVMVAAGAQAANGVRPLAGNGWPWTVLIGALVLVWLLAGIGLLQRLNLVTVLLLFGLSVLLSRLVFRLDAVPAAPQAVLSFSDALELSIAMPISWLPLIADYISNAARPKMTCFVSAAVYGIVSCWMYAIGTAAALYAGQSDIAAIMMQAGLGISALLIVLLSTVTTTFLDVYSAGVSLQSISRRLPARLGACMVCALSVGIALAFDTSAFENFLYWIGSVFVPMAAVQLADAFIMENVEEARRRFLRNGILWALGFILYRVALRTALPLGSTLPVVAAILAIACLQRLVRNCAKKIWAARVR